MTAVNPFFSPGSLLDLYRWQMGREDAELKKLAARYHINVEEADWLRTLTLCLAIEHTKGFYKSIGGSLTTLNWTLLTNKAALSFPRARGAPSKKFKLHIRQDRLLTEACRMREINPRLTLRSIAKNLANRSYIIAGDQKPLSERVLYNFLRAAERRAKKSLPREQFRGRASLLGTIMDERPAETSP